MLLLYQFKGTPRRPTKGDTTMKKSIYTVYIDGIERIHGDHIKYLKARAIEDIEDFGGYHIEIMRGNKCYAVKFGDKPWLRTDWHAVA